MPHGYGPFYSLSGATGTGPGAPADTGASTDGILCQIVITDTATVTIEASEDLVNWTNVSIPASGFTASTFVHLDPKVPFYRGNVAAFTSGSVTVMMAFGRGRQNQMMNTAGVLSAAGGQGPGLAQLLQGYVPTSRRIDTTAPLAGGGNLSTDRTFSIAITPTNNGGAVALQAATPGTAQTGHFRISGTGTVGRIIAAVAGAFTALRGDATDSGGVGVAGVAGDNIGVSGDATTGKGISGVATGAAGIGVFGSSWLGASGLFQSGLNSNTVATLVTKRVAGGTANLFEVQDESGADLYSIDANGIPSFPLASNPPCCHVTNAGQIGVDPSATATYTTESYDTDAMHDNATNPSRITIKTAGVYAFVAGAGWEPNVTADRKIEFGKNGATTPFIVNQWAFPSGSATQYMQVAATMKLAVNDYVEVLLTQNSGAPINTVDNFFSATWVGVG